VPVVVLFQQVVRVVGRDEREAVLPRHPDQRLVRDGLFRDGVVHDLKEEVLLPHDVPIEKRALQGFLFTPLKNQRRDLPGEAGGRNDQPVLVLREQRMIYPGLAVKTVGVGDGTEFDEVAVPLVVFGQEDQVVVLSALLPRCVPFGIDVDLAPYDRLDTGRSALVVELDGSVHRAMVGHRHGGHAEFDGLGGEIAAPDCAVEKTVLRMNVQMDKLSCHSLEIPRFISAPSLPQEAAPLHAPPALQG